MHDKYAHMQKEEVELPSPHIPSRVSPEAQLKRAVNITALLSFLMIVFSVGRATVYPYIERMLSSLFANDLQTYSAILDVYGMFEYTLGFLIPLGVVLLMFRDRIFRPYIPFTPRMPKHAISAIFAIVAVLYVFGALTDALCSFYDTIGLPPMYHEPQLPHSPIRILLYFISAVILPALLEEMIFRGYILHLLLPWGKTFAIVVSSLLFGLMHLYVPQILYATVAGILIGYFVVRTQSIWIGVLIHCVNNLFSFLFDMAYLYLSNRHYEWFCVLTEASLFLFGIIGVLILFRSNAHADFTPQFETNAVYSRSIDSRTVWRRAITVPMLLYILCAAYYTVINSFRLEEIL